MSRPDDVTLSAVLQKQKLRPVWNQQNVRKTLKVTALFCSPVFVGILLLKPSVFFRRISSLLHVSPGTDG